MADRLSFRGLFCYDERGIKLGHLGDPNPGYFGFINQTKLEYTLQKNEFIMGVKGTALDQNLEYIVQF